MKLPIVSRKKYERARNNFNKMTEAKTELQKKYVECQILKNDLEEANKILVNNIEIIKQDKENLKKEIVRLKTLCTKNGIKYKKEEK